MQTTLSSAQICLDPSQTAPRFVQTLRWHTKIRKASTTVDWQHRESVRAKLRNLIMRLLRKYKYPPDDAMEAIEMVMKQAEALAARWSSQ